MTRRPSPRDPTPVPCSVWYLWASAAPRRVDPLVAAAVGFFDAIAVRPARMLVSRSKGRGGWVRYRHDRLVELAVDADVTSLLIYGLGEGGAPGLHVFLRDQPGLSAHTTRRQMEIFVPRLTGCDEPAILELLAVATREYPVVQGGAAYLTSEDDAISEASLVGHSHLAPAVDSRLRFDSWNERLALGLVDAGEPDPGRVRRLYPVTIFSQRLWAELPPLPDVDPAPTLRDLGDCKMLTVWPELVDPHDLQFLLGTRELRRWLWPHTIQNPADDPDEIDSKLRWAGLLPW